MLLRYNQHFNKQDKRNETITHWHYKNETAITQWQPQDKRLHLYYWAVFVTLRSRQMHCIIPMTLPA